MWTDRRTSIYFSATSRIFLSFIASLLLFAFLALSSDFMVSSIFGSKVTKQQIETDALVAEIQTRIDENAFTYSDMKEVKDLWSNSSYKLHFFSVPDGIPEDERYSIINNTYFLYKLNFKDSIGAVLVISNITRQTYFFYLIFSGVLAGFTFFILTLREISRIAKMIKTIEAEVSIIAKGDLQHKIKIHGERELINLAENINHMGEALYNQNLKEKLEEQNKRMLITNLSHDLRTPLTSIGGYIELIKSVSEENGDIFKYACTAEKNTIRLKKLIDDMFFYSKLISEDAKITLTDCNISIVLQQITELRESEVKIFSDVANAIVEVDVDSLHRAVSNLLDNAEKYKSPNSDIIIRISRDGERIIISVENMTDEDISEKLDLLTQRMYSAREERNGSSSGLGLSIVVELLKPFGGKLLLSCINNLFIASIVLQIKK